MSFPRRPEVQLRLALLALGLFALVCLILRDALIGGGAYYQRDLLAIHMPMAETFVRTVAEGSFPFRDPTIGFGQPMLGNPDAQIPYPTTWLHLFMLPEQAYLVFLILHYFLGATGAAALSWRFSGSASAAFFAGAFWVTGGPMLSMLTLWHHLAGAAWIPWVLIALDHAFEKCDRRAGLLLAAAFGLQILAGSAEMCATTLALSTLLLACHAQGSVWPRFVSQVRLALVALAIALCLGAAAWLSVVDVWRFSNRAALTEAARVYWSFQPWQFLEFFLPLSLASLDLTPEARQLFFGAPSPFLASAFLGSLTLPLLVGALWSSRIPLKHRVFAGVGGLVCLLLSLGNNTPFFNVASVLLPAVQIFRYPVKLLVPFSLFAAVLAGAALARIGDDRRVAWITGAAAALILGLQAFLLTRSPELVTPFLGQAPEALARSLDRLMPNLAISIVALIVLLAALVRGQPNLARAASLAAVAGALFLHRDLNPVVDRSALRNRPHTLDALRTAEPSRVYIEDYVTFPDLSRRFLGRPAPFQQGRPSDPREAAALVSSLRSLLIPPVGSSWGVEHGWDTDMRKLFDQTLHKLTIRLRLVEGTPEFVRMLQIGNVARVLALHTSSFELLEKGPVLPSPLPESLYVFHVPETLPRAYAVSGVRVEESSRAAGVFLDPAFVPRHEVVLDQGTPTPISRSFESRVSIESRRADRVSLQVRLNQPGTVVLLEGFLPGWGATLDGASIPVRRANALFIAAAVPAGEHQVVFTYRPLAGVIGLSLSTVTALVLAIALLRPSVKRTIV